MKKCDQYISDLHKQLTSCYTFVEKAQKALTEKQRDLELKTQQLEIKLSNKKEENMHSRSPHREFSKVLSQQDLLQLCACPKALRNGDEATHIRNQMGSVCHGILAISGLP
ncbi:Growth arrest-specific protein 7 [Sciurus carolinensis]|uniref:Growth arrest-specific protein 7 n=1 Tax=Sciurus carolinensis TaxID=30640 RepID=A0AA41MCS0_SCICA|nr:Growth arrest-specific protein 7 [Sciurus carolinensis]